MAKKSPIRQNAREVVIDDPIVDIPIGEVGTEGTYARFVVDDVTYFVDRAALSRFGSSRVVPPIYARLYALKPTKEFYRTIRVRSREILEEIADQWAQIQTNSRKLIPVEKERGNFLAPLNRNGSRICRDTTRPRDKY